ncbi:MAG: AAA family ATPase [Patescibacteria group bacterium]
MKTVFISGVCGVGKSTLMPYLRELLPTSFVVVDFDSRGVPDGADHAWRKNEAAHWIAEGATYRESGQQLVVCGFVKPGDFESSQLRELEIIVLDADADTIRERLVGRYTKDGIFDEAQTVIGKPVMEFIDGNVWYAKKMREESAEEGLSIVDTSNKAPEEVAREVARIITNS